MLPDEAFGIPSLQALDYDQQDLLNWSLGDFFNSDNDSLAHKTLRIYRRRAINNKGNTKRQWSAGDYPMLSCGVKTHFLTVSLPL